MHGFCGAEQFAAGVRLRRGISGRRKAFVGVETFEPRAQGFRIERRGNSKQRHRPLAYDLDIAATEMRLTAGTTAKRQKAGPKARSGARLKRSLCVAAPWGRK